MQKLIYSILTVVVISSLTFAQMKLQLPAEVTSENNETLLNRNIESNFQLNVLPEATAPGGMKDFVKGMFLLGILADISLPFGEGDDELTGNTFEPGFKHIASTGFSGHVVASYVVTTSFLVSLRGGYISFGTKTQEGEEFGSTYKWENKFSQIPILIGGYYLIPTGSGFRPYVGTALGVFIQNYEFTGTYTYEGLQKIQQEISEETADVSSTGFGIVPAVGFYYLIGSVALHLAVEYTYLFSKLEFTEDDYEFSELSKISGVAGIAQEEEYKESYNVNYLSFLLGVSFPLGK